MTRRDSIPHFLFLALALGLSAINPVLAANDAPPTAAIATAAVCAATTNDQLAAARKALQSDDRAARAALACLIDATSRLNDQLKNCQQGRSASGVWHVPTTTVVPGSAGPQ